MKNPKLLIFGIPLLVAIGFFLSTTINLNPKNVIGEKRDCFIEQEIDPKINQKTNDSIKQEVNPFIGQKLDSLNGVYVYYNGDVNHVLEREVTKDGYNIGLKYQCVEFVKRYYYEALHHKMPNSYGHAKDFYNKKLKDGQKSTERNLTQYSNRSSSKPEVNDLIVYSETTFNVYGHVAIVSQVHEDSIEIIQQNPGPKDDSRETYILINQDRKWHINNELVLGWLRKQ